MEHQESPMISVIEIVFQQPQISSFYIISFTFVISTVDIHTTDIWIKTCCNLCLRQKLHKWITYFGDLECKLFRKHSLRDFRQVSTLSPRSNFSSDLTIRYLDRPETLNCDNSCSRAWPVFSSSQAVALIVSQCGQRRNCD